MGQGCRQHDPAKLVQAVSEAGTLSKERDRHLAAGGTKRILSLDGGGVHGLITLGILVHVERELANRSKNPKSFRLSQYFDLIGGTSVGALIGTLLAMGKTVSEVVEIFLRIAPRIFDDSRRLQGYRSKFDSHAFAREIHRVLTDVIAERAAKGGEPLAAADVTLDTDLLETGLAIVAKRADSNSVWVLTNNPRSKYWVPEGWFWRGLPIAEREYFVPNRDYHLEQVLRASASAPYYFDPIEIQISDGVGGAFIDGGASPFNNPAQELFFMAALRPQDGVEGRSPTGFEWTTGEKNLLLLSVGAGKVPVSRNVDDVMSSSAAGLAFNALLDIIDNSSEAATAWMQAISRPVVGERVDSNLQDLRGLTIVSEPLLTFSRLNPELSAKWLTTNLGAQYNYLPEWIAGLHAIDNAEEFNLNRCFEIGLGMGDKLVRPDLFPSCFDLESETMGAQVT